MFRGRSPKNFQQSKVSIKSESVPNQKKISKPTSMFASHSKASSNSTKTETKLNVRNFQEQNFPNKNKKTVEVLKTFRDITTTSNSFHQITNFLKDNGIKTPDLPVMENTWDDVLALLNKVTSKGTLNHETYDKIFKYSHKAKLINEILNTLPENLVNQETLNTLFEVDIHSANGLLYIKEIMHEIGDTKINSLQQTELTWIADNISNPYAIKSYLLLFKFELNNPINLQTVEEFGPDIYTLFQLIKNKSLTQTNFEIYAKQAKCIERIWRHIYDTKSFDSDLREFLIKQSDYILAIYDDHFNIPYPPPISLEQFNNMLLEITPMWALKQLARAFPNIEAINGVINLVTLKMVEKNIKKIDIKWMTENIEKLPELYLPYVHILYSGLNDRKNLCELAKYADCARSVKTLFLFEEEQLFSLNQNNFDNVVRIGDQANHVSRTLEYVNPSERKAAYQFLVTEKEHVSTLFHNQVCNLNVEGKMLSLEELKKMLQEEKIRLRKEKGIFDPKKVYENRQHVTLLPPTKFRWGGNARKDESLTENCEARKNWKPV